MITYASTFLSHSSFDKPLVELVARELGRRGILCWLDKSELRAGLSLSEALREAVKRQATVTLFLSPTSVRSSWVSDEVAVAIEMERNPETRDRIIPVFLGDPLELVRSHELLRSRWLHSDGDRVDRLGITVRDPLDPALRGSEVAAQIAIGIYGRLAFTHRRDILIYLDQRGEGTRTGDPRNLPKSAESLDAPALVFRSDLGMRTRSETLYGDEWKDASSAMKAALSEALGGVRWPEPKNIRVYGDAQLGFYFLLGRYFDRSSSAHLYCTNTGTKQVFNNCDQRRTSPLTAGDPHCETAHSMIKAIPRDARCESISLLLCRMKNPGGPTSVDYVEPVLRYLDSVGSEKPSVLVSHGDFETNGDVMKYIADVVALLMRLQTENGVTSADLFTSLPNNVLTILAANLLHVIPSVTFMEYRSDLRDRHPRPQDTYVALTSGLGKRSLDETVIDDG